ncbi:WXG100 family type VII secretion target [Actinomycetospora rhizophila]|uniref:WXG100 family type VII secretion target n=1 Tax=Actinomycetospora rhizophila TaxID=1416876 RepID=A0ABV9Z8I1_9PSEU
MAELGEIADPLLLVPGDAEAARAIARSMVAFAGDLTQAGDGLARISTPDGWSGEAADAFRERFALQPPAWQDAGAAFTTASRALDIYAETLDWAQRRAVEAVGIGEPGRAVLDDARAQLAAAGDGAARMLDEAAAAAPVSPSFWEDVGDVLGDVGRDAVNAMASLGNAAINNLPAVAAMAGGAGLMLLGGTGAVGGGALTVTGAGAPAGVPLTVASAGLVATGAGIAGAGAISMAINASGDDRVEPLGSGGSAGAGPPIRPSAQRPTVKNARLNRIVDALYHGANSPTRIGDGTTADAIRWERASGATVGGKMHIQKGIDNIRAIKRWLRQNPHASPQDRGVAQNELANLLDALGRTW